MSGSKEAIDPKEEFVQPAESEAGSEAVSSDDAGQASAEPAEGVESAEAGLAAEVEALQAQVAQYHDQLLRAHAEVENVRRRAQEDVSKARKFGIESFAENLIPVRDSLEAALSQPDQTAEAWQAGVEATLKQLNGAFERNQLTEVAPEPGARFDPHFHQAISSVPSDEHPQGVVVMRLQKGYALADRVLRPALVTVSGGPPA